MRGDVVIVLVFVIRTGIFVAMALCARIIAMSLNDLSVKFYESFPRLRVLPNSHLAGTQLNYKSSLIFFRALGIIGALANLYLLVRTLQLVHR